MKHIKTGMLLCLLCLVFPIGAGAQTATEDAVPADRDSLVHVAYGTVNIKDLNGAISVLNPSEYMEKGFSNGAFFHPQAYVGGSNLWRIGNNVLILVDGVPRQDGEVTSTEIEQITYLKGANAVVLYGSRAADGVILITTKRGIVGDRQISVRANAGINVPKSYPEYLGSAEYMTYYNRALSYDGMAPRFSDEEIYNHSLGTNPYRYPSVDYYSSDYLSKVSNSYSAIADFTSGTEKAQFFATAGLIRENTLINFGEGKNEGITRFNMRGNVDLKLNDFIHSYTRVSTVFYNMRYAKGNYWGQAGSIQPHRFSPLVPIEMVDPSNSNAQSLIRNSRHVIDGKYLLGGSQEYLTNPFADIYAAGYGKYTSRQFQFTTGLNFDLDRVLKGLSLNGQFSVDYSNYYTETIDKGYAVYLPSWSNYGDGNLIADLTQYGKDVNSGQNNLSGTWNDQLIDFNIHLDYARSFEGKHNVSAMLLAAGLRERQTGDYQNRVNTNMGVQFTYNFKHRYYADFSGAMISSTKLSKSNRVAFSPTASLGWVLSEEDFLKDSKGVDRLKLTASAGIINTDLDLVNTDSGNAEKSGYYLYNEVYASTAYFNWNDGPPDGYQNRTTTISRSANPDLKYAKRKEINFGLEGSFFERLLSLRATAFFIKKDGIPLQASSAYPSFFLSYYPESSFYPYVNHDANSYKGFDFQLNINKQVGQVGLELGVSGTYMNSKALKRDEMYADAYQNRTGKPVDAMWGLRNDGFFMSDAEVENSPEQKFGVVRAGDIRYKDQNDDNVIDGRDEVMIGRWNAPFTCGLHFTATWKDFTLFVLANGQFGGTGMTSSDYYWVSGDKKYSAVVRDSWTEETKATAAYPKLTTLAGDNNFRGSDFWTYSTDQVNIANVQLTYNMPQRWFTGSSIKGLSVYVCGYDLLQISANRKIMELNTGSSPQTRFYNIGVKARF